MTLKANTSQNLLGINRNAHFVHIQNGVGRRKGVKCQIFVTAVERQMLNLQQKGSREYIDSEDV
jgi:transcription-repair coupling factor (superfamily II helicase)